MRLIRDSAWWLFCWFCWRAYTWLPWPMVRGKFGLRLLPYAGMYAYSETWADFRDCVARKAA